MKTTPFLAFNALILLGVLSTGFFLGTSPKESINHVPRNSFTWSHTQTVYFSQQVSSEDYKKIERYLIQTPSENYHIPVNERRQHGDIMIDNTSSCTGGECTSITEVTKLGKAELGPYRVTAFGDVASIKAGISYFSIDKSVDEVSRAESLDNPAYCQVPDLIEPMGCASFL